MMARSFPGRRLSPMACYFVLFQLIAQCAVGVLILMAVQRAGDNSKESQGHNIFLSASKHAGASSSSAAVDSVSHIRKQLSFTQNERSWLSVVYHEEVSPVLRPPQEVFNNSIPLKQFCEEALQKPDAKKSTIYARHAVFRNAMLVQRQLLLPSTIDCSQLPRAFHLHTPYHIGQNSTPVLEIRVVPNTDSFLDFEPRYSCHERVYEPSVLFSFINWPQHGHAMFNAISVLWETFQSNETGPLSRAGKNVRLYAYGDSVNADRRQEWQQYAPFLHMEHLDSVMTMFSQQPVRSLASLLMQSERHPVCFTYLVAGISGTLDHYNFNVPLQGWKDFANAVRAHFGVPPTPRLSGNVQPLERLIPENLEVEGQWKMEDVEPLESIPPIDWKNESLSHRPRLVILNRRDNRKILNTKQLLDIARKNSAFKSVALVYFEDLSLEEQIRLLGETDMLFGMDGTGLMNGIVMPEGAIVVHVRPYGCAEFLQMKGTNFDRMLAANPGRVMRYESDDKKTTVFPVDIPERLELVFNHSSTYSYRFPFILRQDTKVDTIAFRCILESGAKLLHGIPVDWADHKRCTKSVFL